MLVPRDSGTPENAPLIFPSLWRKCRSSLLLLPLLSWAEQWTKCLCVLRLQSSDVSTFFPFLVSSGSESAYWKYVRVLLSIKKSTASENLITEWMNHPGSCLQDWNPQTWSCLTLVLHYLLYRGTAMVWSSTCCVLRPLFLNWTSGMKLRWLFILFSLGSLENAIHFT